LRRWRTASYRQIPAATDTSCSPEGEADPTTFSAPSGSPSLGILVTDCEAGDLVACDLLTLVAPIGSEESQTGWTCAGRVPAGALPDCSTRLG